MSRDEFNRNTATKIRLRRLRLKMTQNELADKIGISRTLLTNYESGNYNFRLYTLIDICRVLKIRVIL